ncbi:MAG: hypothetical protein WAU75_20465 [Solirubrobacteraceae bacterium]
MAGKRKEPDKLAQAIGAGGGAFVGALIGGPVGALAVGAIGHWIAGEASKQGL